jgi:hypothetical protein
VRKTAHDFADNERAIFYNEPAGHRGEAKRKEGMHM